ncbi:RICIN domain-containing protein [Streptomyces sp. RK76]|nr:RICIN domain-containing protein [Streptomyces sp. RK76]QFX86748.1 hydrogenase expression protein [Streptomyces sp. SYP-A7193]
MPEQQQAAGAGSAQGEAQAAAPQTPAGEARVVGRDSVRAGDDGASGTAAPTAGAETSAGGTAAPRPRPGVSVVASSSGPDTAGDMPRGTAAAGAAPASSAAGTDPDTDTTSGSARRGRWRALTLAAGSGDGRTEGATATAATGADGGPPDSGTDAPGRPKKPVLAGAAMAGALLIAVPLLIVATSGDKAKDSDKVAAGSSDTLLDSGDVPPGDFVAQPPSTRKAEKETKDEKPGEPQEAPQKKVAPPPGAAGSVPGTASPTTRGSKPATQKETTRKETTQRKVAPQQRSYSVPNVLTRVLIKNNTNANCVDLPGFGDGKRDGRVVQSTCNSNADDNQLWNLEKRYAGGGPGGAPLFQIRNIKDGMCLDLPGYGAAGGGTKVTEYPCNGTTADNQLWWLDQQPDGKFWIRNVASDNQCLDSYSAGATTRDLIIWPCAPESRNNHEWFTTPH